MSDVELEQNCTVSKNDKRKRSDKSSASDLDSSLGEVKTSGKPKSKKKKEVIAESTEISGDKMDPDIHAQLKQINKKLSNVLTKDDTSIKSLIRETFKMMKNEFLESVSHRIDILEGKLFEKEEENTKLKEKIENLEKENDKIKTEQIKANTATENDQNKLKEEINNLEQYGRKNNLRFDGLFEDKHETAEQSGRKVAECLNTLIPNLFIRKCDIDIAHRLNRKKDQHGRPRQIIVKFVSRMTRDRIWQHRQLLARSRIFVNEDLTPKNAYVMACLRKKQPDEVDSSWSANGKLFFKNKSGSVHEVKYKDFDHWIHLDWPEKSNSMNME